MSMEDLKKNNENIGKKIDSAVEQAEKMSDEAKAEKEALGDMPGGLDDDIMSAISSAMESVNDDAKADIEGVKTSALAEAKREADNLISEVNKKIQDNSTAQQKLDGIAGKYGKSAISKALGDIQANTDIGNDIISDANKASESGSQKLDALLGSF